jgi:peptidoglycan hydrolase CwlO-like protein
MKFLTASLCAFTLIAAPLRADSTKTNQASLLAKKESYQKKIEHDLDHLGQKVENLRHRSAKAGVDTRTKIDGEIDYLQKDLETAKEKLGILKNQSADEWEKLRAGLDQTMKDLKKSYRKTASKL